MKDWIFSLNTRISLETEERAFPFSIRECAQKYPCGKCQLPVTYDHKGLLCDTCNHWFHAPCQRVGDHLYDYLSKSDCSWHCTRCNSLNYAKASSHDLSSLSSENRFSPLSLNASPVHDFTPDSTSTPSKTRPHRTYKVDKPLKFAHINFRSIREKKPQFHSFVEIYRPDIIVGTETWLTPDIFDAELFPPELGYTIYRRDRVNQRGGVGSTQPSFLKADQISKPTAKTSGYS